MRYCYLVTTAVGAVLVAIPVHAQQVLADSAADPSANVKSQGENTNQAKSASVASSNVNPQANTTAASAVAESENGTIIVTARRVSERLQDVPMSITALSGAKIEQLGVRTVVDIGKIAPGLSAVTSGRTTTPVFQLRGQRATDVIITQDQPVAVYLDESIQSPAPGLNLGLFDLENVQVLKGPQGTLFGRNTTGGAILFTAAKPTDRFEGSIRAGYSNFDTYSATGVLNVPVNEAIRLRAAVDYTNSGGFGKILAGPDAGQGLVSRDEFNIRLTAAVDPTDWLKTNTTFYYSRANDGPAAFQVLDTPNPTGNASLVFNYDYSTGVPVYTGALDAAVARSQARSRHDSESSLPINYSRTRTYGIIHTDTVELGDNLILKNIFGYRKLINADASDFDGTILPILDSYNRQDVETYSEELQLQGKAFDSKLSYIFGAYYYVLQGTDGSGLNDQPATVIFGQRGTAGGHVKNQSFSAFGQVSYKLTDTLNFTGGLRFTQDTRNGQLINGNNPLTVCNFTDENGVPLPANACAYKIDKSFSKPTYLVSIDKKLNDDTLVYLSHRYGYRAGGFNLRASSNEAAQTTFQPETVKDLELGLKSVLNLGSDVRLTADLAGYYQWYSNIQKSVNTVSSSGQVAGVVLNAAKAHIYGGEATLDLRFRRLIDLNFNYAYVKPKYDSYPVVAPVFGVQGTPDDYSNRGFTYVSRHQINASLAITPDIGSAGKLGFTTSVYYQSSWILSEDFQNRAQLIRRIFPYQAATLPTDTLYKQKGYALVNMRLELADIGGSTLTAAIFSRNLFNKRYIDFVVPFQDSLGMDVGSYGPPRTYGAEVTYRF